MMPWEEYQSEDPAQVSANFPKAESDLTGYGALHPDDQAIQDQLDQTPNNLQELDSEIAKQKDPKLKAILLAEKSRLSAMPPAQQPDQTATPPIMPVSDTSGPWDDYKKDASGPWNDYAQGTEEHWYDPLTRDMNPLKDIQGAYKDPKAEADKMSNQMLGALHGIAGGLTSFGRGVAGVTKLGMESMNPFMNRGVFLQHLADELHATKEAGNLPDKFLNEKGKAALLTPEAQDIEKILALPFLPAQKLEDWARENGHEDLANAIGLTTIVGGGLVGGEGFLKKGKAKVEVKPDVTDWNPDKPATSFDELSKQEAAAKGVEPDSEPLSKADIKELNKSRKASKMPKADTVESYQKAMEATDDPHTLALIEEAKRQGMSEEGLRQYALDIWDEPTRPAVGEVVGQKDMFDPVQGEIQDKANVVGKKASEDAAWESYNRDKEIGDLMDYGLQKERFAADQAPLDLTPEQSSPNIGVDLLDTSRPINSRGFGGKQRGAVNFGRGDEAGRVKDLAENTLHLDRSGENLREGVTVRLMNGKTGVITKVAGDRYVIKGRDFADSVPRQGIDYAYSPNMKPGSLSKVFNRQRGAIDLSAFFGKKEAPVSEPLSKDTWKDILHELRTGSTSPEEFRLKLSLVSDDPAFQKNFVDNAEALYKSIPKDEKWTPVYDQLDSQAQRASADLRPWDKFKKAMNFTRMDKNGKEIPYQLPASDDMSGAQSTWQPVHILSQSNWDHATTKVFKNIVSRTQAIKNMGDKLLTDLRQHLVPFADLKRGEMKEMINAMTKYDGMKNDILRSKNLQWATPDMLKADGLSDRQIAAYQALTKGIDKAWDLVKLAFKKMGQEPPERIPGYFPRFWTGSWRVMIKDAEGKLIEIQPFHLRMSAKGAMKKAQKMGLDAEMIPPQSYIKEANFVPELIQALEVYKNKKGLNGVILNKLLQLNEYTQRGIVKDVLEREGVKGYDAEKGIKPEGLYFWNRWHNNRLIKAYDVHFENVSRFWENVNVIGDVAAPLYRDFGLFEHTPHFRDAVTDFFGRATGNEVNHFKKVDQLIRATMIKLGLPVHGVHTVLFEANRFMTWSKLNSTNVGFVVSNVVQPMLALGDLYQIHADRANEGVKLGNPYTAMSTLLRELTNIQQGKGSADSLAALKWAQDNGKLDTSAPMHLDPLQNSSVPAKINDLVAKKLGRVVEVRGRTAAFLGAYSYFKQVMPKREALEASANRMDIMMGNYERMNASAMYTDFGIAGNIIKPFAQLRNTYYGRAGQAIQTIKNAPDIKSLPRASVPFALMMGSYIMGAGVNGMLGAAEYDLFASLYNKWFNPETPLPLSGEMATKIGLPDWTVFGLLAKATGVNIGPSVSAPAFTEFGGAPGVQALMQTATLIKEGVRGAITGKTHSEKIYEAAKRLAPPMLAPWIEDYIAEKQGGNVPHSSNFDATRPRTDTEDTLFKLTGKRALTEQKERSALRYNTIEDAQNSAWKKEQVNEIVTSILGYSASDKDAGELISEALQADKGFTAKTLRTAIKEELKRRVTPEYIRKLKQAANSTNVAEKARKIKQLQDLMR